MVHLTILLQIKETLHISSNPVYCLFVRFKDQCFFGTLFKKLASRRDELL